jgi:methylthioribose-1-phosphate isomerase
LPEYHDPVEVLSTLSTSLNASSGASLNSKVKALALTAEGVQLLDQNALPRHVQYILVQTAQEMADAIETMKVRGAPAIGIAGAYGVVLSARYFFKPELSLDLLRENIRADIRRLIQTRPTAVNLSWALGEMEKILDAPAASPADLLEALTARALAIHEEDIRACQKIGEYGASLIPTGANILTHCNAGALATGGYGTALGVVRSAFAADPGIHVFADETRPRFQGARLTTWELLEDHIPVTLVADNMSGMLMQQGKIDVVIVGADRITANGDTANKIGTYNLALVAQAHGVPFYVAAPLSTIDLSLVSGKDIPIEERNPEEISTINREVICAPGTRFYNPAFDVTPARLITGIITEKGIARPDYRDSLAALFN